MVQRSGAIAQVVTFSISSGHERLIHGLRRVDRSVFPVISDTLTGTKSRFKVEIETQRERFTIQNGGILIISPRGKRTNTP